MGGSFLEFLMNFEFWWNHDQSEKYFIFILCDQTTIGNAVAKSLDHENPNFDNKWN